MLTINNVKLVQVEVLAEKVFSMHYFFNTQMHVQFHQFHLWSAYIESVPYSLLFDNTATDAVYLHLLQENLMPDIREQFEDAKDYYCQQDGAHPIVM